LQHNTTKRANGCLLGMTDILKLKGEVGGGGSKERKWGNKGDDGLEPVQRTLAGPNSEEIGEIPDLRDWAKVPTNKKDQHTQIFKQKMLSPGYSRGWKAHSPGWGVV